MRPTGLLVALLLAVGVAGTAVALRSREGDTLLLAQQQDLSPVSAAAVQRLMLTTSDPRPGSSGRAHGARCVPESHTALGNPWTCTVRYPRLPRIRYRTTVYADGAIHGLGLPEGVLRGTTLSVRGCCVGSP